MPAFQPCSPPSPPPMSISWSPSNSNPSSPANPVTRTLRRAGAGQFAALLASTGQLEQLGRHFTLLAPSDEALAELPDEATRDPALLHRLLDFHQIPDQLLLAGQLGECDYVPSNQGQRLGCTIEARGQVRVDGAALVRTDLPAAGGVAHVIDRVLVPAELDLIELLWLSDSHERLVTACEVLGLEDRLRGSLAFTLLAPRGLTTMPTWRWNALLQPSERPALRALVHRHLIPSRVYLDGSGSAVRARNLEGRMLAIEHERGTTTIDGHLVRTADIEARNGLIHVIEGCLA